MASKKAVVDAAKVSRIAGAMEELFEGALGYGCADGIDAELGYLTESLAGLKKSLRAVRGKIAKLRAAVADAQQKVYEEVLK